MMKRKLARELHEERLKNDPDYAAQYTALENEFSIARATIQARKQAMLTQAQLAERMGTSQTAIARLEGGQLPSMKTLERLAEATGTELRVSFEPKKTGTGG